MPTKPIMMAPIGTSARFGRTWLRAGGEQRADGDADREDRETQRHHALAAADDVLDQRRQQRQHDRADQPEPGDDHHAVPQPVARHRASSTGRGRGPGIGVDGQIGRGRRRCAECGRQRPRTAAPARPRPMRPSPYGGAGDELAAGDGADQDRHEGRAFDQRVAGRELADRELVRQHRVFHRAEQGGDDAEQRRARRTAAAPNAGRSRPAAKAAAKISANFSRLATTDLTYLSASSPPRPGQDEEGKDEDRARDRHQRIAVAGRGAVEQDDDERVLEHVVVERREELRPEQRREAA